MRYSIAKCLKDVNIKEKVFHEIDASDDFILHKAKIQAKRNHPNINLSSMKIIRHNLKIE